MFDTSCLLYLGCVSVLPSNVKGLLFSNMDVLWGRKDKRYDELHLCVFFGPCREKEIVEHLKTRKIIFKRLNLNFYII